MTSTMRRRVRRRWGIVGAMVVLAALAGVASAIHDDDVFQIDGNAFASDLGSPATSGDDWSSIFSNTDNALVTTGIVPDDLSQTTDRIFTGGATKDDLDVTGWRHTVGSVPDKDNIEHAFAAAYNTCPDVQPDAQHPDADTDTDPDFCVYFGLDRFARNGDAQVGFWFFQDQVAPITTGAGAGTFSGAHSVGDILVLSHFTNGGVVGTVQVYEWVGTGGDTNGTLDLIAVEGSCPTTGTVHTTCGASNTAVKPSPWFYDAKSGPDNFFPQGSFYEGGLNLSALGHGDVCVSSFIAETRSSQSVDAVLKDFGFGNFNLCSARITIGQDGVNRIGTPHPVAVTITTTKNGVDRPAPDGTVVDLEIVSGPGTLSADTCTTANGTCSVMLTSGVTGLTRVHASADVDVGNTTISVETDGESPNSDDLFKRWVDARIAIDPDDVNRVGEAHTFTVTVEADSGTGSFAAANVAAVTVGLAGDADNVVDNCANGTGDAGDTPAEAVGTCAVTFTSDTPGTVTGSASASVSLTTPQGNINLPVSTTDANSTTGNAIKRFVDARISIDPDDVNRVNDRHTFGVLLEANTGSGWAAFDDDAVTVTLSGVPAGADNVVDTCGNGTGDAADSEAVGQCFVSFTSDAPTVITGSASVTVSLSTPQGNISFLVATTHANSTTGNAVKRFVDARISIDPDDVNRVGENHTFTVLVEANDGSGWAAVDDDAVTVNLSGDAESVVDTCANGTGDAGDSEPTGTCFVTFTSDTPGTVTGSASATVTLTTAQGNISVPVATADANSPTGDAVKRFVDARISITPTDTNGVNELHTFGVLVEANSGAGWAAIDDEAVTVSLSGDPSGADNVVDTCANGTGDVADSEAVGSCRVTFTSDVATVITGSASATVNLTTAQGNINVPVSTTDANSPTGNAVKTFLSGTLIWHKEDGDGNPLGGATFQVCRTATLDTATDPETLVPDDPAVCVSVVDDVAAGGTPTLDENEAPGEFLMTGLVLGTYTVRETAAPAGYHIGNTGTVTAGSHSLDADPDILVLEIEEPFVNLKAFRLIVLTCDDITDELVTSEVWLDLNDNDIEDPGEVTTTIENLPAHLNGITESDICGTSGTGDDIPSDGIGGSSYGNLDPGIYNPRVRLPL